MLPDNYAFLTQGQKDAFNSGTATTTPATFNNSGVQNVSASTNTINSANLSNAQPINFVNPNKQQPYNISGLNTGVNTSAEPAPLSDIEKRLQGMTENAVTDNNSLQNEASDQAMANETQGVNTLVKSKNELSSQIQALVNQSLDLQNKATYTIPNQVELKGKGNVTSDAILNRQTKEELQKNQIQQGTIASQALTLKSSYEAVSGNLATAQYYADQAVKQKYDPIKARLEANNRNLDLIMKSPSYTNEQKTRAEAQLRKNETEKKTIEKKENDDKAKGDAVIKLISLNPKLDTVSVQALQAAKTPMEVAQIANYLGLQTEKLGAQPVSVEEYQFAQKNGYKGTFSQYQNEDANRKASVAKAGVANNANNFGLSPNQVFNATQSLKKTATTNTSIARELERQVGIMNTTYNRLANGQAKDLNGTSQAIIITFNKLLDPASVVREAEYDRSSAGQALLSTIQGKMAAIAQGGPGLTKASLKELVDLGNAYASGAKASIESSNKLAREEAQYFGLNPNFVSAPPTGSTTQTPVISVGQTVTGKDGKQYKKVDGGYVLI